MTKLRSRGLTLVELLIALVLSLLLLSAAVSIFLASKESFRLQEDLSILQENYRYISDLFKKDFSMVGYNGCATPYKQNNRTTKAFISGLGTTEVIQGVEGGGGPDAVTITYAMPESGITVIEAGADTSSPLYVSRNQPLYDALSDNFSSGSTVPVILLVGNCDHADLFMVTSVADVTTPSLGIPAGSIHHAANVPIDGIYNTSPDLSEVYGRPGDQIASVYSRTDVTYEVDTVGGVTGLYETRNGGAQVLVVDNVTDMQILYGIDSPASEDGNADNYQDWRNDLEVSDITSIKITLTMVVTQDKGADVERDYTFTIKLRDMGLD